MGLLEVLPRLRTSAAGCARPARHRAPAPDVLVTIDSPGFTLHVLQAIRPLGIPRAHYVAPQVWAWREGRVKHYPGRWDTLLCLLPFEPAFFAAPRPSRHLRRPSGAGERRRPGRRRAVPRRPRHSARGRGSDRSCRAAAAPRCRGCCRSSAATLRRLARVVPGLVPWCRSPPWSRARARAPHRLAGAAGDRDRADDKHDAFAASQRRAHQIGHLDPGTRPGRSADGGRLSGQPAHRR